MLLGGDAVAASPGPAVYTPLAAEQGLPLLYLPAPTADPVAAMALLETFGLRGASVTMPHKAALSAVATPRGFAARVGAVNTLSPRTPPPNSATPRDPARWWGDNTDGLGVRGALEQALGAAARAEGGASLPRVRVLGTGGAARAAGFALAEAGWSVQVCGRRPEAAASLAAAVGGEAIGWAHRAEPPFDVLVNATPLGTQPDESPMPDATPWAGRTALDMLLSPRPTKLLQQVAAGGGRAVAGHQMWVHQGAAQWELLTGRRVSAAQLEARLRALRDPADAAPAPPPPSPAREGA